MELSLWAACEGLAPSDTFASDLATITRLGREDDRSRAKPAQMRGANQSIYLAPSPDVRLVQGERERERTPKSRAG